MVTLCAVYQLPKLGLARLYAVTIVNGTGKYRNGKRKKKLKTKTKLRWVQWEALAFELVTDIHKQLTRRILLKERIETSAEWIVVSLRPCFCLVIVKMERKITATDLNEPKRYGVGVGTDLFFSPLMCSSLCSKKPFNVCTSECIPTDSQWLVATIY